MSIRFQILGSSSSGNCALIETSQARVLVDAGFSGRRIQQMLAMRNLTLEQIDAVFITHEHADHASGVRGLSKYEHLEFYATEATARALQDRLTRNVRWKLFTAGSTFAFRDLRVESISIPHDAYDPVCFIFRNGCGDLFEPCSSVAWLTDLGYIPEGLAERVRDVDVLVIEANHDLELLEQDVKRPFSVKQRIRGRHGHLSNDAAHQFLCSVREPIWRKVYLVHISRDCNCLERVARMFMGGSLPWPIEIVDPG